MTTTLPRYNKEADMLDFERVEIVTEDNCKKKFYLTIEDFNKHLDNRYCSNCKGKPCIHLIKVNFTDHGDFALLGCCSKECEIQIVKKYK
jgi:hypothetical protein